VTAAAATATTTAATVSIATAGIVTAVAIVSIADVFSVELSRRFDALDSVNTNARGRRRSGCADDDGESKEKGSAELHYLMLLNVKELLDEVEVAPLHRACRLGSTRRAMVVKYDLLFASLAFSGFRSRVIL
jgi:hypothetical protein